MAVITCYLHIPSSPTDERRTSKLVTRQPDNSQPAFGLTLTIQIRSATGFFLSLAIFSVVCLLQISLPFVHYN